MTQGTIHYLPYASSSEHYFSKLCDLEGCVWLDSGRERTVDARYDIFTALPIRYLDSPSQGELDAALQDLGVRAPFSSEIEDLPFIGGAIGAVDYEALHKQFALDAPSSMQNIWGIYSWALIQDHDKKQCCVVTLPCCSEAFTTELLDRLKTTVPEINKQYACKEFKPDISREEYRAAIEKIHEYIRSGDCYQINFTQRFSADFQGDSAVAYIVLRNALSGPYSAYINFPQRKVLSFSPEQFVKIQQGHAQTKPIKGTIRRGTSTQEDEALKTALLESEKNRAENLMIVDLLRNDFGKSCVAGSVRTPHLFALESYKNVHHLVSTVVGELRDDIGALDFFYRCFPGGSITGAPKRRAMEIIDELETYSRQIYCGSIAYLSANHHMDSSITIRTLQIENEKAYCWGGGGIVADSLESDEYDESIQKVKVLMDALCNS